MSSVFYTRGKNKDLKSVTFKIADCGMARDNSSREPKSPNVVTIWYRPPEILLGNRDYTDKADVWSLGCTIFEIIAGRPLFHGEDTHEMFKMIYRFNGETPSTTELEKIGNSKVTTPPRKIKKIDLAKQFSNYRQDYLHYVSKFNSSKVSGI